MYPLAMLNWNWKKSLNLERDIVEENIKSYGIFVVLINF